MKKNIDKGEHNNMTAYVDTNEPTNEPNESQTEKEGEENTLANSTFKERFQYVPLYILGLILYWGITSSVENSLVDDDIIVLAYVLSVPIVLVTLILKNKFNNQWLFHSVLAIFGAPLWMLALSPLLLILFAFVYL